MTRIAVFPPLFDTNPYQRLLYSALGELGVAYEAPRSLSGAWLRHARRDIAAIHLHWLEYIVWSGRSGASRWLADHARGVGLGALTAVVSHLRPLVWTVHNLEPHEPRHGRLERIVSHAVARGASDLVVHTASAARRVERAYGRSDRVWVLPHGNYIDAYPPPTVGREETRKRLGIPPDAYLYLAFGEVRPFKRLPSLVQDFKVASVADSHLLIYGKAQFPAYEDPLTAAIDGDPRITRVPRWVPAAQVSEVLTASDALVLNYDDVFSSGTLLLALSFGLPVIARDSDTVLDTAEPPAVVPFASGGLKAGLVAATEGDQRERRTAALRAAKRHSWGDHAAGLARLFKGLPAYEAQQ